MFVSYSIIEWGEGVQVLPIHGMQTLVHMLVTLSAYLQHNLNNVNVIAVLCLLAWNYVTEHSVRGLISIAATSQSDDLPCRDI